MMDINKILNFKLKAFKIIQYERNFEIEYK